MMLEVLIQNPIIAFMAGFAVVLVILNKFGVFDLKVGEGKGVDVLSQLGAKIDATKHDTEVLAKEVDDLKKARINHGERIYGLEAIQKERSK